MQRAHYKGAVGGVASCGEECPRIPFSRVWGERLDTLSLRFLLARRRVLGGLEGDGDGICVPGDEYWVVFGPFRGGGAGQTAQNSGTMAKTGAFFCKTTQKRVGGGGRR